MPPIPSASSSDSYRKNSSSRGRDGFHPNTPLGPNDQDQDGMSTGLHIVGETGYLPSNSRKKSTAEKLSDTGFRLYTLEDANKLPKILKPKKKVKGSKRKKIKDDQSTSSNETQEGLSNSQPDELTKDDKNGNLDDPSTGERDGDLYNKYGLDRRREFSKFLVRNFLKKGKTID